VNSQLGLFDRPAPYAKASVTSKAAADAIQPKAATLRAIVLAFIRGRGAHGATDEEMQADLRIEGNTQRPRRRELVQAGLVRQANITRETQSGRAAVVWVAT